MEMILGFTRCVIASNSMGNYLPQREQKKLGDKIAMSKADSKILIACEDSESFSAISKFEIFPAWMHGSEAIDVVNFSQFWEEQSWGKAVNAATGADRIIVSLSGRMDLPVPVRRWMESWRNYEHANHVTLVVVFGSGPGDGPRQNVLRPYFQQIAEDHGMDFLCHYDDAKNYVTQPPASERANQMEMPQAV
jgi:hypothetical protein